MILCIADEAGVLEAKARHPLDVFVSAGVLVGAERWLEVDSRIEALRAKYNLADQDEIHTALIESEMLTKTQDKISGFASLSPARRVVEVQKCWAEALDGLSRSVDSHKSV